MEKKLVCDLTHMMSMIDLMTISMETPRIEINH